MENKLFNPKYFNKSFSITEYSEKNLKEMLSKMLYIRKVEQKIALEKKWINWWASPSWSWSRSYSCWNISKFKKN